MMKSKSMLLVLLMLLSALMAAVPAAAEDPGPADFQPMGTQRVVLAELFTGAWCGYCPEAHQAMQIAEQTYDRDEVVVLAWHGSDLLSFSEGTERIQWVGISGYPTAIFDGVSRDVGGGASGNAVFQRYQPKITTRENKASDLRMTVDWVFDETTAKGTVWVNITAVETPTLGSLKLHTVVFENDYGPYNGGNGESYHDFVARDMLESEGSAGTTLSITKGETKRFTYNFDASSYAQDTDEIGVIGFVQSHGASKEVLQAAYVGVPVLPNVPPVISNGQVVAPEDANQDDDVTFKVFYRDPDDDKDDGPSEAKVFFKNDTSGVTEHDLTDVASSNNWIQGRWLQYTTKLDPGTYTYRFNATDGEDFARGDDKWNTTRITIKPRNKLPELMAPDFAPKSGDTNTDFRFDIMYRDRDIQAPVEAKVVINDVEHDMVTDSTGPWNDWQYFYLDTRLPVGDSHRFYYWFSDGIDTVRYPALGDSPNWIRGPDVTPPNNAPTLTTDIFNPKAGTRQTEFTFTVIYTDGENDHPTISYIYIDDVPAIMMPNSYNYVSGAQFYYKTKLDLGTHYYYFVFSDGSYDVRYPAAGSMEGPTVENLAPVADFSDPTDGVRYTPEQYVPFSATDSTDPEGDDLTYSWVSDLEGELSTAEAFDRRLSIEGTHTITLTVTDEHGESDSVSFQVLIRPYVAHAYIEDHEAPAERPLEQDMVRFTVFINNDGEIRASGVDVRFLVDDEDVSTDTVSVDIGTSVEVRFSWIAVAGDHAIRFEIDGDSIDFVQTVDANTPPEAEIGVLTIGDEVPKHKVGREITFQANADDSNADDLTFEWDFGDGVTSYMENPAHVYTRPGTYTVTLTVTDSRGGSVTRTFDVTVTRPKTDDSPGFAALLAASAMLLALLGAASIRRRH